MNIPTYLTVFLPLMALLGLLPLAPTARAAQPEYYELRVYTTQTARQQKLVTDYWQDAAVPAYNRMGIRAVGVFTELEDSATNKIYVLIPYKTAGFITEVPGRLASDSAYQKASAEFMAVPKSDPAYTRFESSLLVAFESMKKLAVPGATAEKKPWVYELRTYQSHNENKGISKVQMFNSGEVPIMQEVGLSPVFFAQAIVGSQMPCLIYMVSGENREEHKKHWKGFFDAPGWKKLSGDPQYKDNVSKVVSVFLKRTAASQI